MRKFKGGTRSSMSEFVLIKKRYYKYNSKIFLSLVSDILAVLEVANFGLISSMSL
jgi:hypothetical protein